MKPLQSGHLRVLPKCKGFRLIQGFVKITQCLLTINIQRLLCTVIKFRVVKEALLFFVQDF